MEKEKERYSVLDHETGEMIPIDKVLLQRIKDNIIEEVTSQLEQNREDALRPNFLKKMIAKTPGENSGNGNRKRS